MARPRYPFRQSRTGQQGRIAIFRSGDSGNNPPSGSRASRGTHVGGGLRNILVLLAHRALDGERVQLALPGLGFASIKLSGVVVYRDQYAVLPFSWAALDVENGSVDAVPLALFQ